MDKAKEMGRRIQAARKKKGLTQKELADDLQLATGTIQQYELGKRTPKNDTLKAIASRLDISPLDLIGLEWFDLQIGAENLSELQKGVSTLQALEQYLKSLGYFLSYEGPVDSTDPNVVLSKDQERTVFTSEQFMAFEKAIADSVDYQVWQQNHKK